MPTALITGASGQMAAYLSRLLIDKGFEITLMTRSKATFSHKRLSSLGCLGCNGAFKLTTYLSDGLSFDYVFHLSARSFVQDSNLEEVSCIQDNLVETHRILNWTFKSNPKSRFIFIGSSEQFGNPIETPQSERTPFNPRNPYGIAKTAAYYLVKYYREYHKMFAATAICFNQESPLRDPRFVTRKITIGIAKAKIFGESFSLGNTSAIRDWSHCRDTVDGIYKMSQQPLAGDFVFGSGQGRSVKEFLNQALIYSPISSEFYSTDNIDLSRPTEGLALIADARKARDVLNWKPQTSFEELVKEMVESDYFELKK